MYNENIINTPDNCMSEIINEESSVLKIAILAKNQTFIHFLPNFSNNSEAFAMPPV